MEGVESLEVHPATHAQRIPFGEIREIGCTWSTGENNTWRRIHRAILIAHVLIILLGRIRDKACERRGLRAIGQRISGRRRLRAIVAALDSIRSLGG